MAEWRPSSAVPAAGLEPSLAKKQAASRLLTVPVTYHEARPAVESRSMPGGGKYRSGVLGNVESVNTNGREVHVGWWDARVSVGHR